jgi:hypothetical protein
MPEFKSGNINRFKVAKSNQNWLFTKIWISLLLCAVVASLIAGQYDDGVKMWQERFIQRGPDGFFLILSDLVHSLTKYIHQFLTLYVQVVKSLIINGNFGA